MPATIPATVKEEIAAIVHDFRSRRPSTVTIVGVLRKLEAMHQIHKEPGRAWRWSEGSVHASDIAAALELCERCRPGAGERMAREVLTHWGFPAGLTIEVGVPALAAGATMTEKAAAVMLRLGRY